MIKMSKDMPVIDININVLGPIKKSRIRLEKGISILYGPTASGKSILLSTLTAIMYKNLGKNSMTWLRNYWIFTHLKRSI